MKTVINKLTEIICGVIKDLLPDSDIHNKISISPTNNEKFGDYQTNIAMMLSKDLKKNPLEIADMVKEKLINNLTDIADIEVVKPGFINFHLKSDFILKVLNTQYPDSQLGVDKIGDNKTVIIDYSSPNAAKPMHIGHIRSTIIGNSIDRIYRFLGYDVVSDNHLGDWGVQFGKLIYGYKNLIDIKQFEIDPMIEMERLYVEVHKLTKDNEDIEKKCKDELIKLQNGDEENTGIWKKLIDISINEFEEKIYKRLDVKFDVYNGESHYRNMLSDVIAELEEKNIITESEGALVAFLDDLGIKTPFIVRKTDGGYNYATTDIATLKYKLTNWKNIDRLIYVTDDRQKLHFEQLFAIAQKLNIDVKLEHITFGLMRMPEGTISTREGGTIKLETLLDEAEKRAYDVVMKASPFLPEDHKKEIAKVVGISAVKYSDLSQNRQSIITFSWDKMLSLDGNTAPYILYSYARIRSIMRKMREEFGEVDFINANFILSEKTEWDIVKKLISFPDMIKIAADSYKPNVIAEYLFELSNLYNSFYQNIPVLKAEKPTRLSRIKLCDMVSKAISLGLNLLGIQVLERM